MSEKAPNYQPVMPDGDAVVRGRGDLQTKMDTVFDKAMLPDGSFAVTDGTVQADGSFRVFSDITGQRVAESFVKGGEHPATVRAYGERLDLVANPSKFDVQTAKRGESHVIGVEESLVVNGVGELGNPNLLGVVSDGTNRSYGIVERKGRVFAVTRRSHDDGNVFYFPQEVSPDNGDNIKSPFYANLNNKEGLTTVDISADNSHETTLHIPGAERVHEQESSGLVRGIMKGKRKREQPLANDAVEEFDVGAADRSIAEELESQKKLTNYFETEKRRKQDAEAYQKDFEESVSIEALTKKHPEAGNIFRPGASIFQDELFIATMSDLDIGTTVIAQGKKSQRLSEKDKVVLRENPEARQILKQLIGNRLGAWIKEHPAERIQRHLGAYDKIDPQLDPPGLATKREKGNSLQDYAFSNQRTVANLLIPSAVVRNYSRRSTKRNRREDDGDQLGAQEYVTNMAFDMIAGDFGPEEQLYKDIRYVDEKRSTIIHLPEIAQHRTTASLIVNGVA